MTRLTAEATPVRRQDDTDNIELVGNTAPIVLAHDRGIDVDADRSVPQMVMDALSEAVRRRASDIHIEVFADGVSLRFRVDGVLQRVESPFRGMNVREVVSYIKLQAQLDIIDRHHAQDGRIDTVYHDVDGSVRQIDMRVSSLPGPHGEDIVLRLLDEQKIGYNLDQLGMAPPLLKRFREMLHTPGGIILVTGPTASGKTTTQYAAISEIRCDEKKIMTVEDPIEYRVPRVNQKQVNAHMSFADYARAFMRQNPDVLMIGEVRDEETAAITLRAAQMGHLVLTTLHTRDARSAVMRLINLGAERSLVASGLLGALSQRLVRKVCTRCAQACEPDAETVSLLPGTPIGAAYRRGRGCSACFGSGYSGQTGVFELLAFDDRLRGLVARGEKLTPKAISPFETMFDDAMAKASEGLTTLEEVVRTVPLPERALHS